MTGRIETGRAALRWLLAAVFALAGVLHLAAPAPFLSIMPDWVPLAGAAVFVSGLCELFGAAGLVLPRTRRLAGVLLALYTVCVYPANVQHMLNDIYGSGGGTGLGWAYHGPRLLFQPVIVWWCLFAGEVTNWPLGVRRRRG